MARSPRGICATSYQKHSKRNLTQNLQALQDAVPADPKVVGSVAIPAKPYTTGIRWVMEYDARDRLTFINRGSHQNSYFYDANSNRTRAIENMRSDQDLDADFTQTDTANTIAGTTYVRQLWQYPTLPATSNRQTGFSQSSKLTTTLANGSTSSVSSASTTVTFTLDAAGNLSSDGLRQFSYDAANRLSSVQIGQNSGGGSEASKITYLHNSAGQRVFKSEPQVAQLAPNSSNLGSGFITWLQANFGWLFAQAQVDATLGQSYVYADGSLGSYNLLGEYGNGGSQAQGRTEYLWLPAPTGQGQPAQLIGIYQNNRFYAAHTDHLGTPRRITDDAAQVVWQWSYSAFGDNPPSGPLKSSLKTNGQTGNVLKATTPSITMNLRMSGQYFDGESGQFYNYYRNYQPQQGRYSQSDPIGLNGGMNRFGYVGGNPLGAVDPMGLQSIVGCANPANAAACAAAGIGASEAGIGIGAPLILTRRPQDMSREEERQYDRHCRNTNDPCAALKAAVNVAIKQAQEKMENMIKDDHGLFGAIGWITHRSDLSGRISSIVAMISLGKKMGCDMSAEEILAANLSIPLFPWN